MRRAAYDEIAAWYDEQTRTSALLNDLVLPAVDQLAGTVAGLRLLDLACGQGVAARRFAEHGAQVTGVDLSAELIALARAYEERQPLGIVYAVDDAQRLTTQADAAFDGVLCNMALSDIPDLAATAATVRRVLRTGGWFVFSIPHPCFQTAASGWIDASEALPRRAVGGYFVEGWWRSAWPGGVRGRVGAIHRTLASYLNTLTAAALPVERLLEPAATGAVAAESPGYQGVPSVLVARCRAV